MRDLVFGLVGGAALLMYGVGKLGNGLEKASGDVMRRILTVLTGRVWSAFLVGAFLTALVQSSTAITVLTVGFVNAGLMRLPQALGVIYGANVGTTITAQLMAVSYHFNLQDYALPIVGVGFAASYLSKNRFLRQIGDAVMGFGLIFLGLKILNGGIPFMQESAALRKFFVDYASIPAIGILLGMGATAMVHSSAATVGIAMVLGQAGLIDIQTAICITLGDNIGTSISAQLASVTGTANARRTAWGHTLFNVVGALAAYLTLPWFTRLVGQVTGHIQPNGGIAAQIANSHTLFNLFAALVFLPLTNVYVRFLEKAIRARPEDLEVEPVFTDKLLLDTPIAAMKATVSEISRAAEIARRMFGLVMEGFYANDEGILDKAERDEDTINAMQKQITEYVVEISKRPLTHSQSLMIPRLISAVNNVERVGDHALSVLRLAREKVEKNLPFSEEALDELRGLEDLVFQMFDQTALSMGRVEKKNVAVLKKVESLENEMDAQSLAAQAGHAKRLEEGDCSVEAGLIFLDVINYLERIADHIYKASLAIGSFSSLPYPE